MNHLYKCKNWYHTNTRKNMGDLTDNREGEKAFPICLWKTPLLAKSTEKNKVLKTSNFFFKRNNFIVYKELLKEGKTKTTSLLQNRECTKKWAIFRKIKANGLKHKNMFNLTHKRNAN